MKTYTIGRGNNCNIVIPDTTDTVSRNHATLTVTDMGKMTITDHSTNGTYVNNIRIAPNTPFPVTRKDSVTFAQMGKLDWNMVPSNNMLKYTAIAVAAVFVLLVAIFGGKAIYDKVSSKTDDTPQPPVENTSEMAADSIAREKAKQDSLKQVREDSIKKAAIDSLDSIKKKAEKHPVHTDKTKTNDKTKKPVDSTSNSTGKEKIKKPVDPTNEKKDNSDDSMPAGGI